jgi:glucose-6-phosphate 1-dehydrogenase
MGTIDRMEDKIESTNSVALVIFGVTGDLTRRKLIPALYELELLNRLPNDLYIVGFARRDWDDEILCKELIQGVKDFGRSKPIDNQCLDKLLHKCHYIQSNFNDLSGYKLLSEWLENMKISNLLFYLATPPESYIDIIHHIGETELNNRKTGWDRIVIEKPYGRDLTSSQLLEKEVHKVFKENQIYRIDHYLGKETVQNILVFRFANGIFEPLWNRQNVDSIQITVSETVGVGTRAGYYETAGVIRDMFQNHLLQLLALTAMEAPVGFNADAVRDEKVKVLRALRPLKSEAVNENTFRAQYASGFIEGKRVTGYKDEKGVTATSKTETYMATRLYVDNWRWAGVPFYIRCGKRLSCRATEVAIHFKQVPLSLFNWQNMAGDAPNLLVLHLQPNEGITLTFGAKAPGPVDQISPVKMDFRYLEAFGVEPPEAYERLLLDCLQGDATLFTRSDEVLYQWTFTTQIIEEWEKSPLHVLPLYESGTWGPPGADDFIGDDGRSWYNVCPI